MMPLRSCHTVMASPSGLLAAWRCTQRGSVFTRQWSRGSVRIDCANLSSTVLGFKQARLRTDDERLASGLPPNWHWRQQIHGLPAVANSKDASGIVYTEEDGYWPCMS